MNCEGLKENVEPIDARGRDPDGEGSVGTGGSENAFDGGGVEAIGGVAVVVRVRGASMSTASRGSSSVDRTCTCTAMSVAPRSQNPHLLPQDVKIVSRTEIFSRNDGEDELAAVDDETVHFLNGLLAQSLKYERPKKRRRIGDENYEYIVQGPQCAL